MVWFYGYIPCHYVWTNEERIEFVSFEEILTPLWFWETNP